MTSHSKHLHCLFLALCLFLFPNLSPGAETFSISGTVLDPAGNPVPETLLTLYNSAGFATTTRASLAGEFALPLLLRGTYVLECYQEGFQKLSRRVVLTDASQTLRLTLALAGLHQDVVVIASRLPELPSETSKSVSLIRNEDLSRRDAVLLTDALRQIPALQIQQLGGPGSLASYRFRGLRPEDAAILVDGFRFLDSSDTKGSARPFLSDLVLTDVERIEVLRGAGSTLYGTNAIGGTVNVVSRQPDEPFAGNLFLEGGSLGLWAASGGLSGQTRSKHLAYSIQADHFNYTRGLDSQDTNRTNRGTARATYDLGSQARLWVRFHLTDAFAFLNESPSPVPNLLPLPAGVFVRQAIAAPRPGATFYPQFNDPDYHQRNRFYGGAARLDHAPNRSWNYSLGYQSLRTRRSIDDGPAISPLAQQLGFEDPPTTARDHYAGALDEVFWRNSFQLATWDSAHIALDFERAALDQTVFGLQTEAAQRSLELQAWNHARLLDGRLQIQAAFQAQRYSLDPPRFSDNTDNPYTNVKDLGVPATYSGDVSLAYFFARSGTKVRLHAGNGYRAPSLFERFGSGGSGIFRLYFGDPALRAERSNFIDGGFDQYAFRNKLQLSATYFYTRLQTIIDFGLPPNDPFRRSFGYLNLKGGNARGVEFSLSIQPARFLEVQASYTLTRSNQPSPTSAGTTRVLGLADHQATFNVNLRPTKRLNLNLQGYALTSHDFPVFGLVFAIPVETYRFPGYTLLDFTASYVLFERERSKMRWITRVDNLLNQEYYQGGFLAPQATVRTGIHFDF